MRPALSASGRPPVSIERSTFVTPAAASSSSMNVPFTVPTRLALRSARFVITGCGLRVITTLRVGKTSTVKSIGFLRDSVMVKPPAIRSPTSRRRLGIRASQPETGRTST